MIFTAHQPKYTKTVEQKLKVYRTISFDFSYNKYKYSSFNETINDKAMLEENSFSSNT